MPTEHFYSFCPLLITMKQWKMTSQSDTSVGELRLIEAETLKFSLVSSKRIQWAASRHLLQL